MSLDPNKRPVILITGMSGSGKSIALKTFEDMGFETIDNLPLPFLESVAKASHISQPLAVTIDVRTRGFAEEQFLQVLEALSQDPLLHPQFVFFDCDDEVLARRYNASRRLHPLAHERPVKEGMRLERHILGPLQKAADLVVDTTQLSVADLKSYLRRCFLPKKAPGLSVSVLSFSYQQGLPREADMVVDARALKNPFYEETMKELSGEDKAVQAYIKKDRIFPSFLNSIQSLIETSIPRFEEEGRGYLTIAVGCTGGQHRSVFIAKTLAEWLQEQEKQVKLKHRDLRKRKTT